MDDVEGAMKTGMHGILVRTGKYRPSDESKLTDPAMYVADDFANAISFLLENQSKL